MKNHPLDGYDYTADVPPGTSLLVQSPDGRIWRLARKGVRYHSDVQTRLHGARPARPPANVAASLRVQVLLDAVLASGGDLPADLPAAAPATTWHAAPSYAGSLAPTDRLEVYADGWVRAVRPIYDDAPRVGARQLTERAKAALARDLAAAPRGVRLPIVQVHERTILIAHDHPDVARAAATPGAREIPASPFDAPRGSNWDVPVTAWRTGAVSG